MHFIKRSLYDCTGGRLVSKPANELISHHNSNAKRLKMPNNDLNMLLKSNINTQTPGITQYHAHLYCNAEGQLTIPSDSLHEMPNVLVKATKKNAEPEKKTTYMIFSSIGLGDYALIQLVLTERNLNTENISGLYEFTKEKITQIKNDPQRGFWEALRWARVYESELEVKNISGWYNVYWL